MKILVYCPRLFRIGGSIFELLAFADFFKFLGNKVNIYYHKIHDAQIETIYDVIKFYNLKFLDLDDFKDNISENEYDLLFTREFYVHKFKIPAIAWCIISGFRISNNVIEYWANSNNTAKLLEVPSLTLTAPIDYSIFRPKDLNAERNIDILTVIRTNEFKDKGGFDFVEIHKKYPNSLMVTTVTNQQDLEFLKSLNIKFVYNLPRVEIAKYMKRSKVFVLASYRESCPLVIYEALNAGCIVVTRDIGCVREQLGSLGFICSNPIECIEQSLLVKNRKDYVKQGMKFDIINVGYKIKQRLNYIKEKLKWIIK